jgi:hypothetical protein
MESPSTPPSLDFRSATVGDWPLAVEIATGSWDNGDYIEERTWRRWTESPQTRLIAAEHDGKMVAFCRLEETGPAEWWLHNTQLSQFYAARRHIAPTRTATGSCGSMASAIPSAMPRSKPAPAPAIQGHSGC